MPDINEVTRARQELHSGGIEDLERRLTALEAQMRIIRTVLVPALESALGGLEQLQAELRSYGER